MINLFDIYDENAKILILGFGREGKSTYNYLRKLYPNRRIGIMDMNTVAADDLSNVDLLCGEDYLKDLEQYDIVVKAPGIALDSETLVRIKVLESQTNLFLRKLRKQVIGISGTKGKSTTSSLIYHLLHEENPNTYLIGNIGIPCFEVLESFDDNTRFVFELSCHQLEYTKYSPGISVLLNFYEEHLDHYGTYENYTNAKRHIYEYQDKNDVLFVNSNIVDVKNIGAKVLVAFDDINSDYNVVERSIKHNNVEKYINVNDTQLLGNHNVFNIAMALAVCQHLGMSDDDFMKNLKTFSPLAHRLEYFGTYNGIRYYDDSISTACETAISALNSIEGVDTIILGGMDRGIDYQPLVSYLLDNYHRNIIVIPDSGLRIYEMLKEQSDSTYMKNVHICDNLEDAANYSKKITREGCACVLSPASASYGFFKNFEERGDYFKKYIKA